MVKGRRRQHGVGLAIKEEIVRKRLARTASQSSASAHVS